MRPAPSVSPAGCHLPASEEDWVRLWGRGRMRRNAGDWHGNIRPALGRPYLLTHFSREMLGRMARGGNVAVGLWVANT
jgi:hypothetical protein